MRLTGNFDLMEMQQAVREDLLKWIIRDIRQETDDVKTFYLERADGREPVYKEGQFLTFVFNFYGREERRSYSVSSSSIIKEPLSITLKRVENGAFSRWLFDKAVPGAVLYSTGIGGMFILPEPVQEEDRFLFFAAGVGITPVFSMIKGLLHRPGNNKVLLVYSNRSIATTVFYNELRRLQEQFGDRFIIEWLFSDHKNLMRARLSRSWMSWFLKKDTGNGFLKDTYAYICGPEDYRWLVQLLLEENGLNPDRIRRELFFQVREKLHQSPPDTSAHTVTIYQAAQTCTVTVQYPDTILSAAKKAGITMPYSCEAGRCASCIATCTSGKVWLAYNEVLTDTDMANGLILTCVGYPVDGDVRIQL